MLNKILIPLDGSIIAEKSIDLAKNWLAPNGEILLVRIAEYEQVLQGPANRLSTYHLAMSADRNLIKAVEYLSKQKEKLEGEGYRVEARAERPISTAAEQIALLAEETEADAIIMTSHGLTGIRRFFLGSVTMAVLQHATKPVIVVPLQDQPTDAIALAETMSAA